eukprot:gnl/MRDRNA2_/MRDRNA2_112633_c0_seq1.p1 gnl/MRDRNA2_/MRDRNA2_112633_c0~~gnl/MRDRNA2_/MRDRNA2_112633_c0_seq1.p1  ORF type:complete len:441 (-),score=61.86 gnl/MRDRNA2_/MRDRNA2_112633_c0_seq1:39-1361(-)
MRFVHTSVLFGVVRLASADVWCGGHRASDCAACPQGNGRDWCNGECKWRGEQCLHESSLESESMNFPYPPDTRPEGCAVQDVKALADHRVSIILPWLAEKWEHLSGTLRALLHFTPDELVEEFIFISDGNEDSKEIELKAMSSKMRVIANAERQGLIRAKMQGVEAAKAPVIVFMEGHCIVNRDWLQPLLQRIVENPKSLAMPSLDIIPQDNWEMYFHNHPGHWRFEWNLNLIFTNPDERMSDPPEPFPTPATSGGIFAMRKDWFQHLGLYDGAMLEWGGDHVEMTMKVWRCGGRIEIVPCSRIGHLFRDPEHRPYDVNVNQVVRNYARLAKVWLKDHIEIFYKVKPEAREMSFEGMDELEEKYNSLGCKSMAWYLENVDHEMAWEADRCCIPGAHGHPAGCEGEAALGRATIDRIMPAMEYIKVRDSARLSQNEKAEEL